MRSVAPVLTNILMHLHSFSQTHSLMCLVARSGEASLRGDGGGILRDRRTQVTMCGLA